MNHREHIEIMVEAIGKPYQAENWYERKLYLQGLSKVLKLETAVTVSPLSTNNLQIGGRDCDILIELFEFMVYIYPNLEEEQKKNLLGNKIYHLLQRRNQKEP